MNKIKAEYNKYVYTVFVFFNYLYLFFRFVFMKLDFFLNVLKLFKIIKLL